ncbi:MAG: DUF3575 domain-containing protein [Odoribacteraceae bacterium]|jgi:hypothetical protein|nr:DUF3575 domain-containing protein [Odoribacteraceae bacterium]
MRKIIFLFAALGLSFTLSAQRIGVKNNLLADATLSPNLALEFSLGERTTLEVYGSYNPFDWKDDKKFKHWIAQPELRYWACERFNGYFFGVHAIVGEFNVANWDLPGGVLSFLNGKRYEGLLYGGGITFGHQWILSKRWSIEAAVGGGYTRFEYDDYLCAKCAPKLKSSSYNYFGLTRTVVSLVYFLH